MSEKNKINNKCTVSNTTVKHEEWCDMASTLLLVPFFHRMYFLENASLVSLYS